MISGILFFILGGIFVKKNGLNPKLEKMDLLDKINCKDLIYGQDVGVNSYLQDGKLLNLLKYNKKHLSRNMFCLKKKYYLDFCYTFLVKRDAGTICNICTSIFDKDIETLENVLIKNQNTATNEMFHFNIETGKVNNAFRHILFLFDMPNILHDILSMTENDFQKLAKKDFTKSKDFDSKQALSSIINIVLEKNLDTQSKTLRSKRLNYVLEVVNRSKRVEIQKFSSDVLCSNDIEKKIRIFVYQEMLNNLARKVGEEYNKLHYDDRRTIENLYCYFDFSGYHSGIYLLFPWSSSEVILNQIWRMYQEKYYATLAEDQDYLCSFGASEYCKIWCNMKNNYYCGNNPQIKDSGVIADNFIPYSHSVAIFGEDGKQFIKFHEENKDGFVEFCEAAHLELKLVFLDKQVCQGLKKLLGARCFFGVLYLALGIGIFDSVCLRVSDSLVVLFGFFISLFSFRMALSYGLSALDCLTKILSSTDSKQEYDRYLRSFFKNKNLVKHDEYKKLLEARDKFRQYNKRTADEKNLCDAACCIVEKINDTDLSKFPEMMKPTQCKYKNKNESK